MQVIEHILTLKEEEKLMALGLLWAWRDARNKVNAGEQLKPVNDIVYKARSVADVGDVVPTVKLPGLGGSRQRWKPPPEGTWKINIDGAFWEQEKKGAWGFVVRDELGHATMAGAGSLETVCDAQTAESHACLAALQAAADQGLQNVILETDSQILVKALQSDMYDRARGGMLFREAKFTMAINFNSVVVVHAPRSYNRVAHESCTTSTLNYWALRVQWNGASGFLIFIRQWRSPD